MRLEMPSKKLVNDGRENIQPWLICFSIIQTAFIASQLPQACGTTAKHYSQPSQQDEDVNLVHVSLVRENDSSQCVYGKQKMISMDQGMKSTYCEAAFFCDNHVGSPHCKCESCPGPLTNCCRNTLTNCIDDPKNCTVASPAVTSQLPSTKPTTTTTATATSHVGTTRRTTTFGTTTHTSTDVPSSYKTTVKAEADSPNKPVPPWSPKTPGNTDTIGAIVVGVISLVAILIALLLYAYYKWRQVTFCDNRGCFTPL